MSPFLQMQRHVSLSKTGFPTSSFSVSNKSSRKKPPLKPRLLATHSFNPFPVLPVQRKRLDRPVVVAKAVVQLSPTARYIQKQEQKLQRTHADQQQKQKYNWVSYIQLIQRLFDRCLSSLLGSVQLTRPPNIVKNNSDYRKLAHYQEIIDKMKDREFMERWLHDKALQTGIFIRYRRLKI